MLATATSLYRLAIEREKPDTEREQGYQQRDLPTIEGALKQMERRYVPAMDHELQRYWLNEYAQLPTAQRLETIDKWLGGGDAKAIDRALDKLDKSRLTATDERMQWFTADRKAFEKSKDPAIQYAVAVMPTLLKLEEERKIRAGETLRRTAAVPAGGGRLQGEQGRVRLSRRQLLAAHHLRQRRAVHQARRQQAAAVHQAGGSGGQSDRRRTLQCAANAARCDRRPSATAGSPIVACARCR